MKKLVLCLALSAFAITLHAGDAKDKMSSCTSSCCSKSSCSKPKVQSPKAGEQK